MNEAATVEVYIVRNAERQGGIEDVTSAIVPVAANAIFAPVGMRLRIM
jgi:hypothetical protein